MITCAVKPANVTLTGLDSPVKEGTAVVVYCHAEGARPAAAISWFNDSSPLQKSAVETTQLQVSSWFVFVFKYTFVADADLSLIAHDGQVDDDDEEVVQNVRRGFHNEC